MYLHLGQNIVVPISSVIGIFDLDNTTGSHLTRAFLNNAEKAGHIVNVSDDLPKSFVVCCEEDKEMIYLSQLASTTLLKRSETVRFD
ncbi:MAG: DUF370 domain-containing protein [Clostridiales bacterium]|jgi:hypothetical protein|nr:DUF370 domain-containing protein [Clostridiales bacterium]